MYLGYFIRRAVGNHSVSSLEHLKILENPGMTSGFGSNIPSHIRGRSEIGHLFVFDRSVDYPTTLLSPLPYESLLDETFGIHCGVVELGKEITKTNNSVKVSFIEYVYSYDKI